jgi:hypothetical protein
LTHACPIINLQVCTLLLAQLERAGQERVRLHGRRDWCQIGPWFPGWRDTGGRRLLLCKRLLLFGASTNATGPIEINRFEPRPHPVIRFNLSFSACVHVHVPGGNHARPGPALPGNQSNKSSACRLLWLLLLEQHSPQQALQLYWHARYSQE